MRHHMRGFIASGAWTAISFAGAGLLGLLALMEFRSGPIIAGLLSVALYVFMAYILPYQVKTVGAQAGESDEPLAPSDDPRIDLLVEAHQHVQTLSEAKANMPLAVAAMIHQLALDAGVIINAVTEEPSKLTPVLRFFTYYLPSTADLASDRVKLAAHAGDARLQEIDHTLARLTEAFAGFKAAVIQPELASVDIDISLLDDALDADLEDLKTR
jgi:hypothetical protein